MTLMSLLLAFGVSMAEIRYEQRSSTLVEEANVISTAYLRTSFVSGEEQRTLRTLVKKYLDKRIAYYDFTRASPEMALNLKETMDLQAKIWEVGADIARRTPTVLISQLLSSFDQMFDLQNRQDYTYTHMVPRIVILLLFTCSCVVSGVMGFSHGTSGSRYFISSALMLIVITFTLFVVIDLDRPQRGFILLSPQVLVDLRNQLGA
jgi:hypothetical protein